uniref:Reverse transcriptase Ty1/copia-type domain-containing protein n=1 Tax=Tanacetum cinerariifolium TaxID=118510 RepID=A0A699IHV7_TANCI|nr:hypothetical protein [Tanacetum cinerariifolium]
MVPKAVLMKSGLVSVNTARLTAVVNAVKGNNVNVDLSLLGSGPDWLFDIDALTRTINYEPIVAGTQSNGFEDPKSSYDDGCKPSSDDGKKVNEDLRKESEYKDQEKKDNINNTNNVNTFNMPALEDISIFNFLSDDHEDDGAEADMNNLDTTIQEEPIKVIHALKDPSWIEAMQEELLQFKNKKDEMGIMIINKARLVAQGYTQEEGIDYDEVFTPVARIDVIRLLLAYASFKGFVVYQMDVKSAFLYEKIAEEVYVCQPPGFEDSDFPDRVYKVEKALYGLHQAPRAWHKGDILLVQVYVDDIIFGVLTFFLGLQVKQKKDAIFISQDKYVAKILKKFEFTEVKIASTPMETQKPLLKDEDGVEVDVHMYRSVIGSLMYLTSSRPKLG